MKTSTLPEKPAARSRGSVLLPLAYPSRRQSGVALIIVLSALVLLSGLMIAFFLSVSTERSGAKTFAENNEARKLADTALNVVIAQIKDGTVGTGTTGWMSQPGLIRTFGASGSQVAAYKLYSSAKMRGDDQFDPANSDTVPTDWYKSPALYTDLNAPVTSGTSDVYPILDATALDLSSADKMKGFDINGAPVDSTSADPNRAPMPVQWLYVLQNGEIVSAKAGGATADSVALDGAATAGNPIIGRVAFWTDDETCKVNINTAAGDLWNDTATPGSYSDMPYGNSGGANALDEKLRINQPVLHEYQRYPGHPATTYLSAVFPSALDTRQKIYDITPRVTYYTVADSTKSDKSSQGGTILTSKNTWSKALPISDGDHLYASVDELNFVTTQSSLTTGTRPSNLFTPHQVKQAKFFLTAQSRAPDLNLFGKPRIGMWPEPANTDGVLNGTAFDKTIAYCSTLKSGSSTKPYYFVRNDSTSPTYDYEHFQRNMDLYAYLQALTENPIPGFGGDFAAKFKTDRDQILTELFDYIRGAINLVDPAAPYTTFNGNLTHASYREALPGIAQVIPIHISGPNITSGTTCGFGRWQTLYTPNLMLFSLKTDAVKPAASGSGIVLPELDSSVKSYRTSDWDCPLIKYKLITRQVQAVFLITPFTPGHGVARITPNLVYQVEGLDGISLVDPLTNTVMPLEFPGTGVVNYNSYSPGRDYLAGSFSGAAGLFYDRLNNWSNTVRTNGNTTLTSAGSSDPSVYPFWSKPITLPYMTTLRDGTRCTGIQGAEFKTPLNLKFSKPITMEIYAIGKNGKVDTARPIQTIALDFKDTQIPTPALYSSYTFNPGSYYYIKSASRSPYKLFSDGDYLDPLINTKVNGFNILPDASRGLVPMGKSVRGDLRLIAATPNIDSGAFVPADGYYNKPAATENRGVWNYKYDWGIWLYNNVRADDNTDGMQAGFDRTGNNAGASGYPGKLVGDVTYNINSGPNSGGSFKGLTAMFYPDPDNTRPLPMTMPNGDPLTNEALLTAVDGSYRPGDWDTGMGDMHNCDGPYINKADEGEVGSGAYTSYDANFSIGTLFSPNRQVPSPVIFGSLSTGVKRGLPWQTLLFCPNPPAKELHPGWGKSTNGTAGPDAKVPYATPPDHLLLDLFTMPVVEPYAISEPFSTAGKINMNYQIAPFSYITRNTGLQAVLRSTRINAIPTVDGTCYRTGNIAVSYRRNIDIDETLKGFKQRFSENRPFRSASEICEMFLIPQGKTVANPASIGSEMRAWWDDYKLTGDNLREKPYTHIYSRLTTKSNSYTVHVRVQALKKVVSDPNQSQWNEKRDRVVGEYRGSFAIERFIDPNDPELKAFNETFFGDTEYNADGTVQKTGQIDPFYKFRIVSTKKFSP